MGYYTNRCIGTASEFSSKCSNYRLPGVVVKAKGLVYTVRHNKAEKRVEVYEGSLDRKNPQLLTWVKLWPGSVMPRPHLGEKALLEVLKKAFASACEEADKLKAAQHHEEQVKTAKENRVVDMAWLADGEQDTFAHYLDRKREDLPLAKMSDDHLANYAFLYYNRSPQDEHAVIMSQLNPNPKDYTAMQFMTAVKERLRWLSRRLAVAEGRYPGHKKPAEMQQVSSEEDWDEIRLTREELEELVKDYGTKPKQFQVNLRAKARYFSKP